MRRNDPQSILRPLRSKNWSHVFIVLFLVILPVFLFPSTHATSMITVRDPLGSFQGTGQTPLFWPGNEKINNTSFENGILQPWTVSSYNANASSATVISPGLNENHAAQLSITSGNLTSSSYERLVQDLSTAQAVFSNTTILQASVQVTSLTGTSAMDRAGVIVSLASSTGTTVRLHYVFASGAGLPANTTSDAYFKVAGFGSPGWISVTRNLASDTQSVFPSLASSIDAVKTVSLYVDSMSVGSPNRDPRIKFYDHFATGTWNSSDTVIFDSDQDGTYQSGDSILYAGTYSPTIGSGVINDPLIKFVDLNHNGIWDSGEPIVYDCGNTIPGDCGNNAVDINEPVISGNPIIGQLLMDPIKQTTTASFDDIQLFSPSTAGNLIVNSGFETGTLGSWGNQAGFSISTTAHDGSYSALGSVTGGTIQLAQSIDSQPRINSQTLFQAYLDNPGVSGTTINDTVDIWLGLSDSKGSPLSVYYYFATGNLAIPSNSTGRLNYGDLRVGILTWIGFNRTLLQDTTPFNSQGFVGPYSVNLVVLELKSQGTATSRSYFDDISLTPGVQPLSMAPSSFYSTSAQNTTYTYTISNVQSGTFSVQVPLGQSVLNITTPTTTTLQSTDYTVSTTPEASLINIPNSTGTRYQIGGTYHLYTTSKNAVATLYASDPSSQAVINLTNSLNPGQRVNLVELSLDPFANGIAGANSTISIWSSNGAMLNSYSGQADTSGFFRVNDISLPSSGGTYTIQATSYSSANVGIRTRQFSIIGPSTPGPYGLILIIGIIVAVAAGLIGFLFYRQRKRNVKVSGALQKQGSVQKNKGPPPKKQ